MAVVLPVSALFERFLCKIVPFRVEYGVEYTIPAAIESSLQQEFPPITSSAIEEQHSFLAVSSCGTILKCSADKDDMVILNRTHSIKLR